MSDIFAADLGELASLGVDAYALIAQPPAGWVPVAPASTTTAANAAFPLLLVALLVFLDIKEKRL